MNNLNILFTYLKKTLLITIGVFSFCVFVNGQIGPGIGAGTFDAQEIVLSASKALSNATNAKYKAIYQGTGAFSTHTPTVNGTITIEKLIADNPLKAKFSSSGQFFRTGGDESQNFNTTFDGLIINRLRQKERAIIRKKIDFNNPTERQLGFVTSFFGGGPYHLLLFELIESEPLKMQLQSTKFDYEGRTVVENVLCHVVYLEFKRDEKKISERWYFGIKDNLPRKYELLATDDKGRHGAFVLTLSNLLVNGKLTDSAFKFIVPKGYAIKPFEPPARPNLLDVDTFAPDWKLLDSQNIEHSLAQYRGKVILLDFWATWCGPCVQAMPDLQKLHDKFKSRNVEVLGINAWEESNSTAYFKEKGFTYTLLLNGEQIASLYQVVNLPTLYIIDSDGKIIYRTTGLHKDVEAVLEQYLKKIEEK